MCYRGDRIGLHEIAEPIRKTRPPAAGLRRGMLGRRKPKPDYRWREGYAPYSLTVPPAGLAAPVVLRPSAPPKKQGYAPGRRTTESQPERGHFLMSFDMALRSHL